MLNFQGVCRNLQEEARWAETIFVYVDGACDVWWVFLCLLYGASRASVQACDMAFPSTEMGMAMKRELKKHKPPISLGDFNSCVHSTHGHQPFYRYRMLQYDLCAKNHGPLSTFSYFLVRIHNRRTCFSVVHLVFCLFFSARLKLKTGWQTASCPGNTGWTFSS